MIRLKTIFSYCVVITYMFKNTTVPYIICCSTRLLTLEIKLICQLKNYIIKGLQCMSIKLNSFPSYRFYFSMLVQQVKSSEVEYRSWSNYVVEVLVLLHFVNIMGWISLTILLARKYSENNLRNNLTLWTGLKTLTILELIYGNFLQYFSVRKQIGSVWK